jgi:Na+/melibiose symporter-like transporter
MLVAILTAALGTQRHVMRYPVELPRERPRFELARTLQEVKTTLRSRGVLPIFGAGLFGGLAGGVMSALLTYIYTYFWELSANQIAVLSTSQMVSSALGILLATRLSMRFGKRSSAVGMQLVGLTLGPAPLILRLIGWFPENGSSWIVPILFTVTSISAGCAIIGGILWYSMTADVVEDSQLRTGRRSEGLLFASTAFIQKCVSGMGLGISGMLLDLVAFPQNAVPGAVAQPILTRLAVVNMLLVGVLYLIAIVCTATFPISEATHRANVARLSGRAPGSGEPGAGDDPTAGEPDVTAA